MLVACFALPQFGIACERARLTHLWGEPLALAGDDGKLCAVSDEAERFGVRAGQSAAGARALCEGLIVLPYDRAAYEIGARCLWDLYAIESSVVEPVSPELCYVEMSGRDILERVRELAAAIATRVRVPAQVGLARTKLVARQAATRSRDAKVVEVPVGREAALLAKVPIEELAILDYKLRQRLQRLGVRTLGDVGRLPSQRLERQFREVGLMLRRLAFGEDGERVKPLWPPRGIERAVAFEDEVADAPTLEEALRRCAEEIAGELTRGREFCRSLTLEVALADGSALQETERLALPLDEEAALHRAARRLFQRLPIEQPLMGVRLQAFDLGAGGAVQLALLDEHEHSRGLPHERRHRLEMTLAYLRRRFGAGAVLPGSLLRQARRIGLWTYPLGHMLDEPVRVATGPQGAPVRYWRRGRPRDVRRVQNRWREAEWFWGSLSERTVYRVETEPSGLCELHRLGVQWRLSALAD